MAASIPRAQMTHAVHPLSIRLSRLARAVRLVLAGTALIAPMAHAQQSTDTVELGATAITGKASNEDAAVTEGTGSYTSRSSSTATKLPLSSRQTPQSVSVITRQRIEDQGMSDLFDVVKFAPGLTLQKTGSDRQSFNARGFQIENIMYDGLPTTTSTFTQDTISGADLAIFDRIEVVRGATGLMTGAGNPSATLNLIQAADRHTAVEHYR